MKKILFVLLIIGSLFACHYSDTNQNSESKHSRKVTLKKTSNLSDPNSYPFDIELTDKHGSPSNSSIALPQNGNPTVVLFWLTTCLPCHIEMKAIKEKYSKWKQETEFNLVAISTDFQKNYQKFIDQNKKYNWPWEVYHDTNRKFRNLMPGQLNGLPQTFVFDKNGNIAYHKRKYSSGDEDILYAKIQSLNQ